MVNAFYPGTLPEALKMLSENRLQPYAGGSDIMLQDTHELPFLFLGEIPELQGVREDEDNIYIGACTTFANAVKSPLLPRIYRICISKIASPAIRNVGTFGGNIGNGSGKADSVLAHYVLNASVRLQSLQGERILPIAKLYRGRKDLDLKPEELITEIIIPKDSILENCYFEKIASRQSLAISNITVAGSWNTTDGRITQIALGIGAAGDTVLRCPELEAQMIGRTSAEIAEHKEEIMRGYLERMDFPLDRTPQAYRKIVCLMIIDYLIDFAD